VTLTALEHTQVTERRAKGEPWQAIAVALGKNESALRRAVKRYMARHNAMPETQDAPPETVRSAPGITEGLNVEAPAFESDDAPPQAVRNPPVGVRESARAPRVVSGLEKILVIPDTHVPFEDELAFGVLLAAGRLLKPDTIVFLGDFADFMSVSFHPRELGRRGYTLKEEAEAVNARLDQIQALGAKRVVFIKGNHEYRLERYLSEKAPSLFGLVDVAALFRFEERGWECVEYRKHLKIGRMHFTHDVGHAGIYAHRQSRMAYEGNVVIGHVHRLSYEVAGTSKGPAHAGIALGWLGDKGAIDYMHAAKAAQWALGFGVAYHERASGNVHVVPVPIVDYRCVVEGQLVEPLRGTSVERRVA
jgi:predicted phosphodiesterase